MQMYASFFRRLIASIIDLFIIILFLAFIQFISGTIGGAFFYILVVLLSWNYFAYQESSASQGTIGKQAMNIIVTDGKGNRISYERATKRFVGKILASIPFFAGFLPILFNEERQGLHDKYAKTLVLLREG
ncbi:MAG TPA: RDD family protein [Methanosarcina sp.]|nr:RDD family protein [Methanosarcina sp.]